MIWVLGIKAANNGAPPNPQLAILVCSDNARLVLFVAPSHGCREVRTARRMQAKRRRLPEWLLTWFSMPFLRGRFSEERIAT